MQATRLVALLALTAIVALPAAVRAADAPSPAPSPVSLQNATAEAQAQAFGDVPRNSPAYKAVQTLEADGLIKGYPDGTFKGQRPLTRYEAALITERVVADVQNKIQQAQAVSENDLAALRTLLTTLKSDIDALNKRVGQVETQQAETKKAVDSLTQTQKRNQFHVLYFLRAPGTFSDAVSGYTANGVPLPSGTSLVTNNALGSGFNTGRNTLDTGFYHQGTGYQVLRAFFDGQVNPNISYHFRLENRYYFDNATNNGSSNGSTGTSSTAPNYCSGAAGSTITTCGNNFPGNSALRLNYANVEILNPSGFKLTLGRFSEQNSTLGLNYSDYFNGARLGYVNGSWNAVVGYGFDFPALSNGSGCGTTSAAPSCTGSGQTLMATTGYAFSKQLNAQLSYATDINPQLTMWNPAATITNSGFTGLYQNANVPISVGSVFIGYNPTPQIRLSAEGLHRFGNDPFTGREWQQSDALWLQGQYGNITGVPNRGYVEGGYIQAGFNSLSGHTNVNGTTNYEQFYLANPNGYRMGYAAAHYWVSQNFRISLGWFGYDLIPGTTIPASSVTCPGCYIAKDAGQAFFLQSLLQF